MEFIRKRQATTDAPSLIPKVVSNKSLTPVIKTGSQHNKLDAILKEVTEGKAKEVTEKEKKGWKLPFKWKKTFNKS